MGAIPLIPDLKLSDFNASKMHLIAMILEEDVPGWCLCKVDVCIILTLGNQIAE